ncbi:MAG: TonB-dependent receptor plug domain-containing protein [Crocinitomicaceae bacterium]|nr:TonB-dependent receptor plug domain-containing protein [Flavobacteriales bacterium]NQZ35211.1 TonB-dependent receptor plug domain-containing protein [Crocinitomicaceae bacterium]
MRFFFLISILLSSVAYGQDTSIVVMDTLPIQELKAVDVITAISIRMETPRYRIMREKEIQDLQANDVGEILQKLEGVNLKSYGGLGGLKTISVRSLGSQHSAIVIDGFSVQNSQTGQVNLSQIQTNNLEMIALGVGEQAGFLVPVSAQIAGNNVSLQTFEMSFPSNEDSLKVRASSRIGSFGQFSGYGAAKVKIKKGFISGFGNYRIANGQYAYQIQNGLETQSAIRSNNDYQDQYFGGVAGYKFKKDIRARVSYKQSKIDQGLPGAVILYNNSADERLLTANQSINSDVKFRIGDGIYARIYANGNTNSMRYFDPTYFNAAGELDITYFNRVLNTGFIAQGHVVKGSEHKYNRGFYFGAEGGLSDLKSSDTLFANPLRKQISGIVGARLGFGHIKFRGHLSSQFVNESNASGEDGKNVISVNPYLSLETRESNWFYARHRVWYRNSLRVPSFNELYYNNIGNTQLNPERANQFGYNFSMFPMDRKGRLISITSGLYFNRITDKIIAIPTQNLFTWSIQNVGIVHAYGGEVAVSTRLAFGTKKQLIVSSSINYSFQRSLDMSDADHPTYQHQIAYIPIHTGNVDVSVSYKKFGGKVTNYLISKRYSLNENNLANEIAGFAITDFSLFYQFEFKKKQSIRLQIQLKNAFNKSYSYIRSFIMPGRNYLISINYAFN